MRGAPLLIDAHGSPIAPSVWELYAHTLRRTGPKPTLIEHDANVPPFAELIAEASAAERILARASARRNSGSRAA